MTKEQKDREVAINNESKDGYLSLIDIATILTLTTATLYYFGITYYTEYFNAYNVKVNVYLLPFEAIISAVSFEFVILTIATSIFMVGLFMFVKVVDRKTPKSANFFKEYYNSLENSISSKFNLGISNTRLRKVASSRFVKFVCCTIYDVGYYVGFLILSYLWIGLVIVSSIYMIIAIGRAVSDKAKIDAADSFKRKTRIEIVTKTDMLLPKELYLYGYVGEDYVVFGESTNSSENDVTCNHKMTFYIINSDEIARVAFLSQ